MLAHNWYEQSIKFEAIDGRRTQVRDDNDEALDDWLASMSVNQFERVLTVLMEHLGGARPSLDGAA